MYADSEHRYLNDPEFRAVVDMLAKLAEEHEFTPGELRQMATFAAWRVEMRRGQSYKHVPRGGRPCR